MNKFYLISMMASPLKAIEATTLKSHIRKGIIISNERNDSYN